MAGNTDKFLNEDGLRKYHAGVVNALKGKANKDEGVYYVKSTSTTNGVWTGTLEGLNSYYFGLTILYETTVEGAEETTLNLNGLGAKTIYKYGVTKLTTEYPANSIVLLTYVPGANKLIDGCWVVTGDYGEDSEESESISNTEIDEILNL